jgi:heme-degrading monooxygenase HmoA
MMTETMRGARVRAWRSAVVLAIVAGMFVPAAVSAQTAAPGDVSSIDGIITALYDVISGPAGEARDWDRFYTLFIPEGARLVPSGRGQQGNATYQVWTPQEYAERAGASLEANGFFEREIGRTTEEFGNVVHVFSAYDSKRTLADAEPFARGINSIQLFHDGTRYWVVTIFWDSERPGNTIPSRYIGG